jgi:acetyl-CoA acyltransferase
MGAGIPINVPSHTVTQACISANQAITSGAEKILSGQAEIILAGGVETFSDVPIRYSKPIRERLLQAQKTMKKGTMATLGLLKGLSLKDLAPEAPAIANYTTGEVMGHSSDRLAAKFGVSRKDQDEFTVRSHVNAAKAHAEGLYDDEIIPVDGSSVENGIKADTTYDKVAKLKPAFIKPHGTHTAANSSFLTDGASACLIMTEEKALELGYKPKAYIRGWTYVASDPFEELLLGPTYATHKILKNLGLQLSDVDVIEIHEVIYATENVKRIVGVYLGCYILLRGRFICCKVYAFPHCIDHFPLHYIHSFSNILI